MWQQFEKLKTRQSRQLELPFNFDDKGHTLEPAIRIELSEFNKKLKQAANFDPNKETLKT